MKTFRILYLIYFLVLLIGAVLLFLQFISLNQFSILFFGDSGLLISFYDTEKLAEGSILKSNKYRIVATLVIIVIFLSCTFFIYYPTIEGIIALGVVNSLIVTGLTLTEWYEKAKLYDSLKRPSSGIQ